MKLADPTSLLSCARCGIRLFLEDVRKQAIINDILIGIQRVVLSFNQDVLQILGNNECFEPYTSNIYVRRVLSGEFTVVNQHLLMDLTRLGLWSPDLKNELVAANGSVLVWHAPLQNTFMALHNSHSLAHSVLGDFLLASLLM